MISEIVIEGCERKTINSIGIGENKTVWIKIPGDCGIYMSYKQGSDYKKKPCRIIYQEEWEVK